MFFLKGNFETFVISSILQVLCHEKKTGKLQISNVNSEIRIIFKKGDIIYAVGSDPSARLSRVLQTKNLITEKRLKQCFRLAMEKKEPLDKFLIEKGLLTAEIFNKVIHEHVEKIIFNLLSWEKGEFEYKDSKISSFERLFSTRIHTIPVLLESSRRINEKSVIKKQVPDENLIYKPGVRIEGKHELRLTANERKILSLIDGTRTVQQIVRETGFEKVIVFKSLFSLISAGLINNIPDSDNFEIKTKKTHAGNHMALYSAIITVYLDIIHIIGKSLETDLGRNYLSVFAECKSEIKLHPPIFEKLDPQNPHAANIHVILKSMENPENFEEKRIFLVNGFNEFLIHLFYRAADILGPKPTMEMLDKIEETLSYADKYQSDEVEKKFLINEINNLALKTREQILYQRDSKKPGRMFSFFRKINAES